jgi:hypothetical protein
MSEPSTTHSEICQSGAPGAAHRRLEAFVGKFRAHVKLWMGPGDPHETSGVMRNTFELGGRFLRQEYEADESEGPFPCFQGRGYWGYNTITNQYEGFWIDTASTMMTTETGQVDTSGKVWTMTGTFHDPETGAPMQKRSVITLRDDDNHAMESFFILPDGKETKVMEIQYERIA